MLRLLTVAAALIAEIQKVGGGADDAVELPTALFQGGLERLLRWVTLLEPEALPRVGLSGSTLDRDETRGGLADLQGWLTKLLKGSTLVTLPVMLAARGGGLQFEDSFFAIPDEKGNTGAGMLRLITPLVERTEDGTARSLAICATPSIWADRALVEIRLEINGQLVWEKHVSRREPIEGPILWPLEPLLPHQHVTIRLRPQGAPAEGFATVTLQAPDAAAMEEGEVAIEQGLHEAFYAAYVDETRKIDPIRGIYPELQARKLIANQRKLANGSQ